MSFKLLAIRPLKGCNNKFLRVLKEDKLYKFYNNYHLEVEKNEVVKITQNAEECPSNLYNIEISSKKQIEINISAIVGKNGSGKSSIIELLYAAFFNISVKAKLLPLENDEGIPIEFEENLRVELFYLIEKDFYRIKLFEETITLKNFTTNDVKRINKKTFLAKEFFYTIAINYSHYALNSDNLGSWVENIFHKNDGYQTPLVLNPFRKRGNIDINDEEYLTKSRLLSNIISPKSENGSYWINKRRTLIPGKTANAIKFSIDDSKIEKAIKTLNSNSLLTKYYIDIIEAIYKQLISKEKQNFKNETNLDFVNKYLVVKIFNISEKYEPYNKLFKFLENQELDKIKLKELLNKLKTEPSHIAFKVHQTINFIENPDFIVNNIGKWISLKQLNDFINSIEKDNSNTINYTPPSFFKFDLQFKDKETLNTLSSGEKQRIFSTSTYKYHIYNLDTVTEHPFKVYENVNIIFDEIELYYHPDFQRSFVSDFLESLKTLKLNRIKQINCIMVTHSPFILSDIPISNTLRLKEGIPEEETNPSQTFGSNIHDLLANDFFMSDGFMGEWAKSKIKSVADYLILKINDNKIRTLENSAIEVDSDERITIIKELKKIKREMSLIEKSNLTIYDCKKLISIVGEPILYNSLIELYLEAFPNDKNDFIISQIENLRKLLR